MGIHMCQYCKDEKGNYIDNPEHVFNNSSSGDITLIFPNDHVYEMPDMIMHYAVDHGWCPPRKFLHDVEYFFPGAVKTSRLQTKGLDVCAPMKIGYLEGDFWKFKLSCDLYRWMEALVQKALDEYGTNIKIRKEKKGSK